MTAAINVPLSFRFKKNALGRLAIKINSIKELHVDFRRKRTVTAPVTPARV